MCMMLMLMMLMMMMMIFPVSLAVIHNRCHMSAARFVSGDLREQTSVDVAIEIEPSCSTVSGTEKIHRFSMPPTADTASPAVALFGDDIPLRALCGVAGP